MKNKFHAISMCTLMAAFATSSWAVDDNPACPASKGFVEVDGDCYYDIPETGGAVPLQLPSGVKTFTLRYQDGGAAFNDTINISCEPQALAKTVSVTSGSVDLEAGSLSIRNRIDVKAFGVDNSMVISTLEGYQSEKDLYNCTGSCGSSSFKPKVIGFNALSIIFNSTSDGELTNGFELTVNQEPYDFGPMQVYNLDSLEQSKIDGLISAVDGALSNPWLSGLFDEKTKTMYTNEVRPLLVSFSIILSKNFSKVALIEGASDNGLVGLTQDIVVDSVYFDREFSSVANARSTLALPFSIASDNIAGASEIWQFTRVGEDPKNPGYDAVFMKKVFCLDPDGDYCPETNGTLEAYKPYIVVMKSGVTSLEFKDPEKGKAVPVTLQGSSMESGYADFKCQNNSNWVFRGVFEKIAWNDEAPDNVYGYAAEGNYKGQFVKAGKGAWINPFRAYLVNTSVSKLAPANSSYALRQNVLPDEMNIVIEGDNNETTVIGSFNTRTGEMKFINNMKHTYDLKGRRVNGTNNARGAYYGKKVLMK